MKAPLYRLGLVVSEGVSPALVEVANLAQNLGGKEAGPMPRLMCNRVGVVTFILAFLMCRCRRM